VTIDIYSSDGKTKKTMKLDANIFSIDVNDVLIKQALQYQLNNARRAVAHTKLKSDVRGGGRKPYQQKGTGRARQGSIRNPHYKGGGVVFGPSSERNFSTKMPRKQRNKALLCALIKKISEKSVFALEEYNIAKTKTKDLLALVNSLPVKRNVLFVTHENVPELKRAAQNLSQVKILQSGYLNIYDILHFDKVCLLKNSVASIEQKFQ